MKNFVVVLLIAVFINGCSTVGRMFPDNSTDYQRAEALPQLEIPPDLSGDGISRSMNIPNEDTRTYTGQSITDMPPDLPGIPSVNPEEDEDESENTTEPQAEADVQEEDE